MKKILMFIYIVCLTVSGVYSQDSYRIDKVVLTVNNYNSKAPSFVKSLNDSAQMVSSEWNFPVLPVFKVVTLEGDKIASVDLLEDGNRYRLDDENTLVLTEILSPKEGVAEVLEGDKAVIESASGFQLPGYTIKQSANQLTIVFDHIIYGSSNYPGQTLEGKCEMMYVKP